MKKKLVSILLSGALLASSLLATFTVVAAGNTAPVGETAVPAVTAAPAEETAAPAEAAPAEAAPAEVAAPEAAPAEVAAPVTAAAPEAATVAADVPAATALAADNTVTVDGKKYQVTVAQDFENYSSTYLDSRGSISTNTNWFNVPIVSNGIGDSKSMKIDCNAQTADGTQFTQFRVFLDASQLSGDGLYFEVATNVELWKGMIGSNNNFVGLSRVAASDFTKNSTNTEAYNIVPSLVDGKTNSYTTDSPKCYMIPWSELTQGAGSAGAKLSDDLESFNSQDGIIKLTLTWNFNGFTRGNLEGAENNKPSFVDGDYVYFDNIGFYSDYVEPGVDAVSTYTTWQNPLSTDGDAVNIQTEDGSGATSLLYDMTFEDHSVKYTMTQKSTHAYQSRMYPKVSGAQLAASDRFELTVTVSNKGMMSNPGAFIMRFVNAASSAGTAIMRQITTTARYYTNEGNTYKISIPVADIASSTEASYSGDLASTQYLNLSFVLNTANANIGDSITLSDLKLLKEDAVTFDPGTKVVNVKPTVSDNSALDVSVTNNGDHDITWSDAKDVSLQVKEGASVTLTAKPAEGMEAVWTNVPGQEGELTQDTVTFTATEEANPSVTFRAATGITIKATSEESVEITVAAKNGQSAKGELSGIEKDTEVTLTAPADSGSKKFSCWKHKDNIISYENVMKVLAKDSTTYTAVYADAPEKAKSTLTFYSITKDSAHSQVVAVFEWHLTSGDVEGKHIGEVKLNITGNGGSKSKTFNSYDIHYQNGYYTLTIKFTGDIPEDLTFTITLDGIDSTVTATSTVDMISEN